MGLGAHFFPDIVLSKKKHEIRCGMRNPYRLKAIRYADFLIDINVYFSSLPGAKASEKIGESGFNENLLNSMLNG